MPRSLTIVLDKPRELRLDYNALSSLDNAVRETHGVGIVKSMLMIAEGDFNFDALRTFYFHALRSDEPGMNPIKAGRIIDEALKNGQGFAELANNALLLLQETGVLQVAEDEEGDDADEDPPMAVEA